MDGVYGNRLSPVVVMCIKSNAKGLIYGEMVSQGEG